MKIRNGFVSNSSSSSFVISHNKGDVPKVKIEIELSRFSRSRIRNRSELLEYVQEQSSYRTIEGAMTDSEYWRRTLTAVIAALDSGQEAMAIEVSNEDGDEASSFLHSLNVDELSQIITDGKVLGAI